MADICPNLTHHCDLDQDNTPVFRDGQVVFPKSASEGKPIQSALEVSDRVDARTFLENKSICPFAAGKLVVSPATVEIVLAVASKEFVRASPPIQLVRLCFAPNPVSTMSISNGV